MLLGFPDPDPDPLVRDMDPRIRTRIRIKISVIPNTGLKGEESCRGFRTSSVPDPGSSVFIFLFLPLDSGSEMEKKIRIWVPGFRNKYPNHMYKSLVTNFVLKILVFFVAEPDPGSSTVPIFLT
jgi:hypothetical protein